VNWLSIIRWNHRHNLGGGSNSSPPIFIPPKNSFWLLSWRQTNKRIGVRLVERGVCILSTDSKQSSPLSNLIHNTHGQFCDPHPPHVISQITPMGEISRPISLAVFISWTQMSSPPSITETEPVSEMQCLNNRNKYVQCVTAVNFQFSKKSIYIMFRVSSFIYRNLWPSDRVKIT